jgi:ubiquinone/menaquinone biosynthesis C-methylase UbiE
MTDNFEKKTRQVFHEIQTAILDDKSQKQRTLLTSSPVYMGVEPSFFEGKACLEAGCGSIAPGTQSMLAAGARMVKAVDLDESIFEIAPKYLAQFDGRYELITGSVMALPFPDQTFDFSLCCAVLHHTSDPLRGLREVCRVTKSGGSIFVNTQGTGGLMKAITRAAHDLYLGDENFRDYIDGLTAEKMHDVLRWIGHEMLANNDKAGSAILADSIAFNLLDQDLVLTIFDRVKAPAYNDITEADFLAVLDEFGFVRRRRINHYHQFENIRRFLAPMYHAPHAPLAKMMYGEGMLEYFATRD